MTWAILLVASLGAVSRPIFAIDGPLASGHASATIQYDESEELNSETEKFGRSSADNEVGAVDSSSAVEEELHSKTDAAGGSSVVEEEELRSKTDAAGGSSVVEEEELHSKTDAAGGSSVVEEEASRAEAGGSRGVSVAKTCAAWSSKIWNNRDPCKGLRTSCGWKSGRLAGGTCKLCKDIDKDDCGKYLGCHLDNKDECAPAPRCHLATTGNCKDFPGCSINVGDLAGWCSSNTCCLVSVPGLTEPFTFVHSPIRGCEVGGTMGVSLGKDKKTLHRDLEVKAALSSSDSPHYVQCQHLNGLWPNLIKKNKTCAAEITDEKIACVMAVAKSILGQKKNNF